MRRIALLLGASLALAGCGGGGGSKATEGPAAGATVQTVSISETEFKLHPGTIDVARPGTVTFKVTNNGQITHALEIEGNGTEKETEKIAPGHSTTLSVPLGRAGSYEMYCPIDGHEDKGMKGAIRVAGSSGTGGTTTSGGTTTTRDGSPGY